MIIDCVTIADAIFKQISDKISLLKRKYNLTPKLVIFQKNTDFASKKYVAIKQQKAKELGIKIEVNHAFNNQNELITQIQKANQNKQVHGYIIQLPLPKKIDPRIIFESIILSKDVDGLSMQAVYRNLVNFPDFYPKPCTAQGIMAVFEAVNYSLAGKNVVLVNRSLIVGKPLISMLLSQNATVTICHTKTQKLNNIIKQADVVISAIGQAHFFDKKMLKPQAFVIDVGISNLNGKLVGDVNLTDVLDHVAYITPVPNGIGKLTVAFLFYNLVNLIWFNIKNYCS